MIENTSGVGHKEILIHESIERKIVYFREGNKSYWKRKGNSWEGVVKDPKR